MNKFTDASKQQQQHQTTHVSIQDPQQPQQTQIQFNHDSSQQGMIQAQNQAGASAVVQAVTPQAPIVNKANIGQQQQAMQSVSMHQGGTGSQQQISLQQQQQHQMQTAQSNGSTLQSPLGTTTITTMSTLQHKQQHPIEAQTPQPQQGQIQQVQVIQQPLQNPTYLQQLYNTQGQLLMPGNIALHTVGMNPGSIQVITAGKTFHPNLLAPHMLTTAQGKQVITQGQPRSFPGYATIPATSNQTLVIRHLGVISSQHDILPAHSAKQDMQKSVSMHQGGTGSQQQISLQQQQQHQMQTAQSNGSTLQSPLGSLPIQQPGATTITTMQAPPGSLAQSAGNTITTMQAPLGTMALQGSGQTITAMQAPPGAMPIHTPQSGTTTITTMSTLQHKQQHPIEAQTPQPQQGQIQQVQVIQQPLQNPTYLQQLYNTQGQLLMPGNIALHTVGMNPGSIQVITAGKTFQPNLLAPHMLTTAQGKQVITQGQPTSFPGYATIPATSNQTLVIRHLGVISSQHDILPAHSAKQDMQKSVSMHQGGTGSQQQISLQQQQQHQMQTAQSNCSTLQSPLGSLPIQQPGATTITTMQAPPGSLAQSAGNTITTMQAPLGTMALQGSGQTITAMQAPPEAMPIHTPQSGTTKITTMSTLQHEQQHPIEAQTPQPQQGQIQQVQVIQQPLQNPTYLQQLYNTQGQLLMPGNIALHTVGMNPGSIQVITAGKTFQPNLLAPHMLTTAQGKQVITQGEPRYATIPTTTNQTLVISQIGVISSQPNILPAHSAKQIMQKYTNCQTGRTVQQNTVQPMKFSPWQFGTSLPQGIAWAPQPPTLLTTQNPIFIRGTTQQDGTAPPMFIQSPPPQTIRTQHPQSIIAQGTLPNLTQITPSGGKTTVVGAKPRTSTNNIQLKTSNNSSGISWPSSNILPSVSGNQAIRPARFVSTQRGVAQHLTQAQMQTQKAQAKLRAKPMIRAVGLTAGQKANAANQRKSQSISPQQHLTTNYKRLSAAKGNAPNSNSGVDNISDDKNIDQHSTDMDTNDSSTGPESSLSSSETPEPPEVRDTEDSFTSESADPAPKLNPLKWTVSDVYDFIRALPGCCEYAEDFAIQEIDGQALMLLKEDHLMSAMAMKLGPALKICAKIDTMRTDGNKTPQQQPAEK